MNQLTKLHYVLLGLLFANTAAIWVYGLTHPDTFAADCAAAKGTIVYQTGAKGTQIRKCATQFAPA